VICPESLRRQFLRLFDDRHRMAQVVKRLHGIHIQTHTFLPQKFHELRVATPSLVPRHIERNDSSLF